MGNTAVSKLGVGMSQKKGPLTSCGDFDGEHGGEQTQSGDVTKEGATHSLRRSKMGNTAVSKHGAGMSQKKGLLTTCGDRRWGTRR